MDLNAEIDALKARVASLEDRLKKNSQNSSKQPSTDVFVKSLPRTQRRRLGKFLGKQAGEPGMRLEPARTAEVVLVHEPGRCGSCGLVLFDASLAGERSGQVFDLPPDPAGSQRASGAHPLVFLRAT